MISLFCISSKLLGDADSWQVYIFVCTLDVNMKYIFTVGHDKKMFENY